MRRPPSLVLYRAIIMLHRSEQSTQQGFLKYDLCSLLEILDHRHWVVQHQLHSLFRSVLHSVEIRDVDVFSRILYRNTQF
jgi:hypothetical protein